MDPKNMKPVPIQPRALSADEVAELIKQLAVLPSRLVVRYDAECAEGRVVQVRAEGNGQIALIVD